MKGLRHSAHHPRGRPESPAKNPVPPGRRREAATAYALVAPAMVLLTAFVLVPGLLAFVAALFRVDLISGSPWTWVGLDNFRAILADPAVQRSIVNTLLYCAITIVPSLAIGLALALLATSIGRGRTLVQTLLFLPFAANLVAMAVVFRYIYGFRGGFVNQVFAVIGIGPVNFLGDPALALPTIATVGIWRASALAMIMYLAGLTSVPTAIHEACAADGITGFTKLRRVLLPLLRPVTVLVTVLMVMQGVQVFDTVNVLTQGGPRGTSETVLTMTWRLGFVYFDLGRGAALCVLVLVTLIAVGIFRRRTLGEGSR